MMAVSRPTNSKNDHRALPLSTPLSLPGHRWGDALGFVPAGSVSSSSRLQIFSDANHLWCLIFPPVYLLGHFPSLRHIQGRTEFWKVDVEHWYMPVWDSDSTFLWQVYWICENDGMCRLADYHLLRKSNMGDCFHQHCQAVGLDYVCCIVFVNGGRTLLDSETPPRHVFGDFSHQCTLWGLAVCCFLKWAAWSLTPFCLLAVLDSAFQSFLAGVSPRDAGIGLGTFPTPWFPWSLSAGILAVLGLLLDPSKTCPSP